MTKPNGENALVESPARAVQTVETVQSRAPELFGRAGLDLSNKADLERAREYARNLITLQKDVIRIALREAGKKAVEDLGGRPHITRGAVRSMLWSLGRYSVEDVVPATIIEERGILTCRTRVVIRHVLLGEHSAWGVSRENEKFIAGLREKYGDGDALNFLETQAEVRAFRRAGIRALGLGQMDWEDFARLGFYRGRGGEFRFRDDDPEQEDADRRGPMGEDQEHPKAKLVRVMNESGVRWSQVAEYARDQDVYHGKRIIDAPEKILRELAAAIQKDPGIFKGLDGIET